jgi:hypothetical protein
MRRGKTALICCVCLGEVATVGRRCVDCVPVEVRASAAKRRTAELLALVDTDPQGALAALEALP